MAIGAEKVDYVAFEPRFEGALVFSAARLGDALGRHLNQAARFEQIFDGVLLMQQLRTSLRMGQDRPNTRLHQASTTGS